MKRTLTIVGLLAVVLFAWTGVVNASSAPTVDASADCQAMTVTVTNDTDTPIVVTLDGGPPTAVAPGATHRWTVGYGRHTVAWTSENGATGSKAVSHHNPPDCAPPASVSPPVSSPPLSAPPTAPPAVTPDAPLVSAPGAPTQLPATGASHSVNFWLALVGSLTAGSFLMVAGWRRP